MLWVWIYACDSPRENQPQVGKFNFEIQGEIAVRINYVELVLHGV